MQNEPNFDLEAMFSTAWRCSGRPVSNLRARGDPTAARSVFLRRSADHARGRASGVRGSMAPPPVFRCRPMHLSKSRYASLLAGETRGSEARTSGSQSAPLTATYYLTTLGSGSRHHRGDLREDRADAGCNARHNRTGGHGHETRHQSVLDEVLTARVLPNSQLPYQILHCIKSPLPLSARQF